MQNTLPAIGELFNRSFNRFKQNIGYYIKNYILTSIMFLPIFGGLLIIGMPTFALILQKLTGTPQFIIGTLAAVCGVAAIIILSSLITATGLDILMVRRASAFQHIQYAWTRTSTMIGVTIISNIVITFSSLFFILPGFYMYFKYIFARIAAMKQGNSVRESIEESKGVSNGRWWAVFGRFLVVLIPLLVLQLVQVSVFSSKNLSVIIAGGLLYAISFVIYLIFVGIYTIELFESSTAQSPMSQIEQ